MGFSRGLLNVATLGAASRVDKVGKIYQTLVDTHNYLVTEIQKAKNEIQPLLASEKEWSHFKRKNKHILNELYNHDTNLSKEQKQALKTFQKDIEIPPAFQGYVQALGDEAASFQDTAFDNSAATVATMVLNIIPGLGVLGAHLTANEQIEKIKSLSNQVEKEIDRIKPIYQQIIKLRTDLILRNQAFQAIQEMAHTYVLPKKKDFFFFTLFFKLFLKKRNKFI